MNRKLIGNHRDLRKKSAFNYIQDHLSSSKKVLAKLIYINENDIDQNIFCDICLDDVVEKDEDGIVTDHVVICDKCNVAVH